MGNNEDQFKANYQRYRLVEMAKNPSAYQNLGEPSWYPKDSAEYTLAMGAMMNPGNSGKRDPNSILSARMEKHNKYNRPDPPGKKLTL